MEMPEEKEQICQEKETSCDEEKKEIEMNSEEMSETCLIGGETSELDQEKNEDTNIPTDNVDILNLEKVENSADCVKGGNDIKTSSE